MPSLPTLRAYTALVAAAALGGGVAVGAVALLGGFEGGTTTLVTQQTPAPSASSTKPVAGAMSVNEIYEHAAPGVVQITSTASGQTSLDPIDPFSSPLPQLPGTSLGSGFVFDKAGNIVTNYHVVEDADRIRVSFSNQDTVVARVVGTDPSTDLAVLRVETSSDALTPLPLGDSDVVRVGDPVVAIGNPFGLARTATAGIVSAVQRYIQAPSGFAIDHVIQTDAPINKGNSGGPLLNSRGEVIGVNTQIETGETGTGNVGIGFAVPSNTVKDVVAQILRTGRVDHAYLGITGRSLTRDLVERFNLPVAEGVLIQSVAPGSGADKAGLEGGETEMVVAGETYVLGGDVIVSLDGKNVTSIDELRDAIAEHKPGDEAKLKVFRDGKRLSVTVTLGRRPPSPQG
ncbi:MAG TPA: trypsin-like peptidase domain-containing protein [Gaiellaceae bacterium]|nr:trypsin-like peptidase domain-containing protein [Gaiellaceae bacterium]